MKIRGLTAIGLLASVPAVLLAAASAAHDPYADFDPALRQVAEKFDAAQAAVTSVSAGFVERKEIGLLKNAVVQEGRFYHTKPDKFLWEYVSPEPKMLLMNGTTLVAYYPTHKQAEEIRTRLSRKLVRYFGLGQIFADMREYYDLSLSEENDLGSSHLIVMTPRQKRLQKRLLEVRIWIDEGINQVRQLEYLEIDGDRTLFKFEDIEVNPSIDPSKYVIHLPADVRVNNTFAGFFSEKGG